MQIFLVDMQLKAKKNIMKMAQNFSTQIFSPLSFRVVGQRKENSNENYVLLAHDH